MELTRSIGMQIPAELAIPQLFDFPPVFELQCKVAMKHYIEQLDCEQRELPKQTLDKLGQMYAKVKDACPHCGQLYLQELERDAACLLDKPSSFAEKEKSAASVSSPNGSRTVQCNLEVSDLGSGSNSQSGAVEALADRFFKEYTALQTDQTEEGVEKLQLACDQLNTALKQAASEGNRAFKLDLQAGALLSRLRESLEMKDELIKERFNERDEQYPVGDETVGGEVEDMQNMHILLKEKDKVIEQLRNELKLVSKQSVISKLYEQFATVPVEPLDSRPESETVDVEELERENENLSIEIEEVYNALRNTESGAKLLNEEVRGQNEELLEENEGLKMQLKAERADKEKYALECREFEEEIRILGTEM